ncbi:MAG TPA: FmdB family zinc ribbon protein [Chloroflexia bacterium]|nr:FmdB family zinc ribbon protein [Chloroflexia bacterium]
MPIYEYECKECGQRFEKMQPVTAEPLTECINCGKGPVRRVFHPVGVIFKGSGWYINDSRKSTSSDSSDSKSDGAAATGGTTASTTKSEKAADAD